MNISRLSRPLVALSLLAAAAPGHALVNGGFEETPTHPYNGSIDGFEELDPGSTAIEGWVVFQPVGAGSGTGVDWINSYWQAGEGNFSLDLNQTGRGGIRQIITGLTAGVTYYVNFLYSGNPTKNQPDSPNKRALFTYGNIGSTESTTLQYNVNAFGNTYSDMKWQQATYSFVSDGSAAIIRLASLTPGATGMAFDAFSISAAPDSATWLSMILGFGIAGTALRRSRQAKVAAATA